MSHTYQLKIELVGSNPTIWRKLTVPGNTFFDDLHDIIQMLMGWKNEYPFEFNINKIRVRDFGVEFDTGGDPNDRDVMDTALDELVTMVKAKFTYIYSAYERRELQITLEEILHSHEAPDRPVCIGGERACPADSLTQAIAPEDVASFKIEEVNANLRRYAEEWEKIDDETGKIIHRLENKDDDGEDDGRE
ncbi:MAG TPA: plasmid pRiA4b ORF-3 family protein [Chryseosolibacter sp.]